MESDKAVACPASKVNVNEQLAREVDYLKAENQVLKNQLAKSGKRLKFIYRTLFTNKRHSFRQSQQASPIGCSKAPSAEKFP